MAKQLSTMTWDDVQKEMSIAGNPEKIAQIGRDIEDLFFTKLDSKNRAELTNVEFMLKRLIAEIKLAQRIYDRTH